MSYNHESNLSIIENEIRRIKRLNEIGSNMAQNPSVNLIRNEKGLTIKTEISISALFGLVVSFLWFMNSKGLINWLDMRDPGLQCVIWLVFWAIMSVLGVKKADIAALGLAIMTIWNDKRTNPEQKLALIMQQVQQWLGWIADISQLIATGAPENQNKKSE
jgi:hypothetical protein